MATGQLPKLTDTEHLALVAVAEGPEPVDGSGLPDLHVDARSVGRCWCAPALPVVARLEQD